VVLLENGESFVFSRIMSFRVRRAISGGQMVMQFPV